MLSCDAVVFTSLVSGSKHAMGAFFRKPTSEQYFLYGVVCFLMECGNLQPVQTVLSAVAVFSPSLFTIFLSQ